MNLLVPFIIDFLTDLSMTITGLDDDVSVDDDHDREAGKDDVSAHTGVASPRT